MDQTLTSAGGLVALGGIFIAANTIILLLRFYARRKQGGAVGPDDWMIIPSYIFFLAMTSCTLYGISRHWIGYSTPKSAAVVLKTKEALEKLYLTFDTFAVLTMGCTKISALLFYRRIFCAASRHGLFEYATIIGIIVVSFWTIAFVVLSFFQCGTHIEAMWTPKISLKYCVYNYPILEGLSVSDMILDFMILVLPMPRIWSIHTNLKRKLAISGVFLFAFAGFGASAGRLAIMLRLIAQGEAHNFTDDPYLVDTEGIYLYVLEAGISLVAVNLPSLWYFQSRLKPESVLQSFRSILSLRSQASRDHSPNSNTLRHKEPMPGKRSHSSSARIGLAQADEATKQESTVSPMPTKRADLEYDLEAGEM